jgi:hypothetical protein
MFSIFFIVFYQILEAVQLDADIAFAIHAVLIPLSYKISCFNGVESYHHHTLRYARDFFHRSLQKRDSLYLIQESLVSYKHWSAVSENSLTVCIKLSLLCLLKMFEHHHNNVVKTIKIIIEFFFFMLYV